ncbi:MAG: hypothetical protein K8R49_07295 [Candidatus Cloacimonetes bacterium]|nr:hypothetical protein [Candidatus Cloacimonadota bacterium]
MAKSIKRIVSFVFVSTLVYLGYKAFLKIKGIIDLNKTLPQYLENIVGEKPGISIVVVFNKMTLTATFSKQTLSKNKDIEKIIRDYINDFYKMFNVKKVDIQLKEKEEEEPKK